MFAFHNIKLAIRWYWLHFNRKVVMNEAIWAESAIRCVGYDASLFLLCKKDLFVNFCKFCFKSCLFVVKPLVFIVYLFSNLFRKIVKCFHAVASRIFGSTF